MCTTLNTNAIPTKATEPVTCWKLLKKVEHLSDRVGLFGPYSNHEYKLGERYKSDNYLFELNMAKSSARGLDQRTDNISRPLGPDKVTMSCGAFHTFVSRDEATRYIREEKLDMDAYELVRCEIPVGAMYVKGSYAIYSHRAVTAEGCRNDGRFMKCGRGHVERPEDSCNKCYKSISSYLSSDLVAVEVVKYVPKPEKRYKAYVNDTRRPGGNEKQLRADYNLTTIECDDKTFWVVGSKKDIEAYLEEYDIIVSEIVPFETTMLK